VTDIAPPVRRLTDDAIEQLAEAWAWRLRVPFRPVLFSTLGDMFFARDDGAVWWLNTGTAELGRRAREFVGRHADEPFFCMVAFNAVHNFCWQLPADELARRGLRQGGVLVRDRRRMVE